MHGMDTQDDNDATMTQDGTTPTPQPYEQLLTEWIVGVASLCNVSNSHPSKPHSLNVAPASKMMSNCLSLQQGHGSVEEQGGRVRIPWLNARGILPVVLRGLIQHPFLLPQPFTVQNDSTHQKPRPGPGQAKAKP